MGYIRKEENISSIITGVLEEGSRRDDFKF